MHIKFDNWQTAAFPISFDKHFTDIHPYLSISTIESEIKGENGKWGTIVRDSVLISCCKGLIHWPPP